MRFIIEFVYIRISVSIFNLRQVERGHALSALGFDFALEYAVKNSMEVSPSWEANSYSSTQEIQGTL
jgi:hypothetical protein